MIIQALKGLVPPKWWIRRCTGCSEMLPHTHHLTGIGKWALR